MKKEQNTINLSFFFLIFFVTKGTILFQCKKVATNNMPSTTIIPISDAIHHSNQ